MSAVLVIAEIGINHNGNVALACEMIAAAKNCGVDVVKFQTYKADEVMTDRTPSRDSHDERHCENARHARSG